MPKNEWKEPDQLVALYLAKKGSPDAAVEDAFISSSGHARNSLKMAISNFRYLLGQGGLSKVSARQRKIFEVWGGVETAQLRTKVLTYIGAPSESVQQVGATSVLASSSGRRLNESELEVAREILTSTRKAIERAAGTDSSLLWALRRKVYKELVYDERSKPMARRMLKFKLFARQKGLCAGCAGELPEKYSILDRREAMKGYTEENCKLLCYECDRKSQAKRKYA